jgi:hypothetical protein
MKQKPLGAKNEKVMGIFLLLPKAFKNKYIPFFCCTLMSLSPIKLAQPSSYY